MKRNRLYMLDFMASTVLLAWPLCVPTQVHGAVPVTFSPARAPEKVEWARFMELPMKEAETLWNEQTFKGTSLAGWNWKWRLAWVRLCAANPGQGTAPSFCDSIIDQASEDKALVVRAEAASAIGQIKDGTMDPVAARKLLAMMKDPRNRRNQVPVMVQKRALYSLVKIGHADSVKAAGQFAAKDPTLRDYWTRLNAGSAR